MLLRKKKREKLQLNIVFLNSNVLFISGGGWLIILSIIEDIFAGSKGMVHKAVKSTSKDVRQQHGHFCSE